MRNQKVDSVKNRARRKTPRRITRKSGRTRRRPDMGGLRREPSERRRMASCGEVWGTTGELKNCTPSDRSAFSVRASPSSQSCLQQHSLPHASRTTGSGEVGRVRAPRMTDCLQLRARFTFSGRLLPVLPLNGPRFSSSAHGYRTSNRACGSAKKHEASAISHVSPSFRMQYV